MIECVEERTGNYQLSCLAGLGGFASNLLVPPTPLIGREQELREARSRLLRPEVRLLTLTGPPGVGKTRLALSLGAQVQQAFAHGLCFVSLASISDPQLVMPAIREALGLSERLDLPAFEHLVDYLREKEVLLLLDEFLHLLPAAPQLSKLLSACPRLKILVSSCALLHLQGEYEFVVPSLSVPDLYRLPEPEDLSHVESVALFLQCAKPVNQGLEITWDNAAIIAEICVRLDGLPLAIELAARRTTLLSLEALLASLEQGLEALTGEKQAVPSHHQTLRRSIGWSYDHLTAEEQMVFRWLAVFVGAFTLDAAEAVAPVLNGMAMSILDGMAALIDKSLLKQREEEPEPRLYLLELVRSYGLERLAACGELEAARSAHAQYYLTLAGQAERISTGASQEYWMERLEWESENIQAALQWLLESQKTEAALRLLVALLQFWVRRGRVSEAQSFLERVMEKARHNGTDHDSPIRAKALYAIGVSALHQNNPAQASIYLEKSVAGLTAREREVLDLLSQGMSNKQIAEQLVLSPFTVSRHVQSIYNKLGISSRSAATRLAIEYQLL